MARDYTKYNVEGLGENLNKRKLVFTVVKDWIEKNNPSLEELQKAFPDEVQGAKGFIRKESEIKTPKHFNMREPIKIKNGMHVVVSNQWGENLIKFIEVAEKLDYNISFTNDTSTDKGLLLPDHLKLKNYNLNWGRFITFQYENGPDCDCENFSIKFDTLTNSIIPFNSNTDDLKSKWFDSWEVNLSSDNQSSYSSVMSISFSNAEEAFDDSDIDWQIVWHDEFEDLMDGDFPGGVSGDIINQIFSNNWFSNLFYFVNTNLR